ncbi:MAG: Gfo/Idh/MocA family oxidoreductase [Pirellulales bacterium]|nr:Gfo/Idh/MocA family oxidoreductase [Pirellulales bacterium]
MNLTPEQKAIGKQNFNAAMGSKLLRRDFLRKGIEQNLASGKGLGPYYFGYDKTIKERLRVGVLGTGDEGSVLMGAINPDFIEVLAIADIRPYNQYRAFHGDYYSDTANKVRCGLMKKYGWKTEDEARKNVKVYGPYQDLIKDAKSLKLEAVIIALPLHLHAPAAIAAMRAGLHVLTEKLMGHSVAECKEMARVAEDGKDEKGNKLHLATGHQRHYNILYNNAVEAIAKGVIGDLHYIRAQWHRGNMPGTDSWQQPLPKEAKPNDALSEKLIKELASWEKKVKELKAAKKPNPKEIQLWENKVAQKKKQIEDKVIADKAKQFGYTDKKIGSGKDIYDRPAIEELIRWRLWNRTGGGLMAELGSHQLDASSIFISAMHGGEKQYPLNVAASSGRLIFGNDRDVDDHVYCLYEYAAPGYDPKDPNNDRKKISVQYASINGNGFGGYGETVFGTNGTLLLEREQDAMLYKTSAVDDPAKVVANKDKATNKKYPVTITTSENGKPIKPDEISAAIGTQAFGTDISRGYTEEIEHWAWCIRNPDPKNLPKCHPKVALADAVIALTTNIAAREGRRIEFKKEWFDPKSDETPEGKKPDVKRYKS